MKNILFIRPDALGDCLLGSSMLAPLKAYYPEAKITVLCQSMAQGIFDRHPAVDQLILLQKNKVKDTSYRSALLTQLKNQNFDLVINPLYSRELALDDFACKVGAERAVTFKVLQRRGRWDFAFRYNRGYSDYVVVQDSFTSELEKYKLFLKSLGIPCPERLEPQIFTDSDDEVWAENFCKQPAVNGKKIILLFAGANSFHRTYNNYGQALALAFKKNQADYVIVALGATSDFSISEDNAVAWGGDFVNLAGKTTMRQAAALMKKAFLGFGAETGLAHLACAIKLPHVILLGGGHFGRFMPYSPYTSAVLLPMSCFKCDWKCKYPEAYCVKKVQPQAFTAALLNAHDYTDKPRLYFEKNKNVSSLGSLDGFDVVYFS